MLPCFDSYILWFHLKEFLEPLTSQSLYVRMYGVSFLFLELHPFTLYTLHNTQYTIHHTLNTLYTIHYTNKYIQIRKVQYKKKQKINNFLFMIFFFLYSNKQPCCAGCSRTPFPMQLHQ